MFPRTQQVGVHQKHRLSHAKEVNLRGSVGLEPDEEQRFERFCDARAYYSSPFQLIDLGYKGLALGSGVVYDLESRLIHEPTIYGNSTGYPAVKPSDGSLYISDWYAGLTKDDTCFFDFGAKKVVYFWHRYSFVYTHKLLETAFSIIAFYRLIADPWNYCCVLPLPLNMRLLEILEAHGIDGEKLIFLPLNSAVVGNIYAPSSLYTGTFYDSDVVFLRDWLVALPGQEKLSKKIYISRRDAKVRPMFNESALESLMAKRGFTCLTLSGLSFSEQAAVFSDASFIVGAHGSGLANTIYCRPGTKVLELGAIGFVDRYPLLDGSFWRIASQADCTYSFLTFGNARENKGWSVDLDRVTDAIDRIEA